MPDLNRREFLASTGALAAAASLPSVLAAKAAVEATTPALCPGSGPTMSFYRGGKLIGRSEGVAGKGAISSWEFTVPPGWTFGNDTSTSVTYTVTEGNPPVITCKSEHDGPTFGCED